jgi:Txe/YoeB family toxin of Txe-Axe toxin-antitoxin module
MTPSKVNNFTVTDFNDGEVDEISDKEFKRMITRIIKKIKEDVNKHMDKLKEKCK